MPVMSARVYLGTQGYGCPDWVGVFYPPGSRQEDYLSLYAHVFDTVELDTTFHRPPKGSVVRSWAEHTPESFRFAVRVPQHIAHDARPLQMAEHLGGFFRALEPLGPRLGPLLVQMPAEFTRDPDTVGLLDRFLSARPAEARLAVEFRHASWHVPATLELLRKRGVALTWTEGRELPRFAHLTADFLYVRWSGDRSEVAKYDRVQIDRTGSFDSWTTDLGRVMNEVREIYGYFDNHWAGHAPESANEMKRHLGLTASEARDWWPQRELF